MSKADQLKAVIAPMLSMRPEDITAATPLTGLQTSLAGARLNIAVKRLGMELPKGPAPANYGALERILTGAATTAAPEASATAETPFRSSNEPAIGLPAGVTGGIDVQQIAELPAAADYWTHEWYSATFSPGEIAWAVTSPEPREHFAGFWCAKEALRKCDADYRNYTPQQTFVVHDEAGKPFLSLAGSNGNTRLPHVVSISHSGPVATALVIQVAGPPVVAPASPPPASVPPAAPPRRLSMSWVFLLALLAVAAFLLRGRL